MHGLQIEPGAVPNRTYRDLGITENRAYQHIVYL